MSAKWTFWAWEVDIKTAPKKLALLQLANNADDDGKSWYSIAKMANACGVSERTFQRQIQSLEGENLLKVDRRNNRSSVYYLQDDACITLLNRGDTLTAGGDRVSGQGDRVTPSGVSESRTILTIDTTNDPNNINKTIAVACESSAEFESFWAMYDKKEGRHKAELKFKKLTSADKAALFAALPQYILATPDKQYRKNPLTWLNGKHWNDELTVNNSQSLDDINNDTSWIEGMDL